MVIVLGTRKDCMSFTTNGLNLYTLVLPDAPSRATTYALGQSKLWKSGIKWWK